MSYDYDALYRQTPDALGPQTPALETVLKRFDGVTLSILDVGCGQGRDALPLARTGHRVHGIDLSAAGVAQMLEAGKAEGLAVTGEVADLAEWSPSAGYDLVLVDRTLHMLPESQRMVVFQTLAGAVAQQGHLLVEDEPNNIAVFLDALDRGWSVEMKAKPRFLARRMA